MAVLITLFLALSGALLSPGATGTLPARVWGGQGIQMTVTDAGADLDFDCASGQITEPLALDAQGHFDVRGTFSAEHGGPVRPDEVDAGRAARYTGQVQDKTMTLTITAGEEKIGTYTLTRDRRAKLVKCR